MIVTVNPATGQEIERFAFMNAAEIDSHLDAARTAFLSWRREPVERRTALLHALAATLRSNSDSLARTAVREMGKPITQARSEVEKCAWCCEYFAERAPEMLADRAAHVDGAKAYVALRPLGVIFAIMPWNFPYWQVFRAAVPALVAGNAMVLKHADGTTRCGLEIERIFHEAGAPESLFKMLLIDHEDADARIADERIAAVTLTGSDRAGVAVGSAAGRALKKSVLELGGSDAFIVLADADIDMAVDYAVRSRFQNNGQSCIAAKRFIIEAPVYDRFVRHFVESAAAQRVGDPLDEQTEIGPMARADLRDGLFRQVTDSVVEGARILTGGNPIDRPGFYFAPTVVADVDESSPMFREETFGPAAAVIRARDDEHAVDLANRSSFGLGSSIWTRDYARGARMAAQVEAGLVFVNGMVASDPRLPFGGVKRSGYGRELSDLGLHEFVNAQSVWIAKNQTTTEPPVPAE
ncbi:MAG TPA: NAD-dependent succinate-semialdehyde dehydrogenase [Candidatus Baltobacteraceae bacterium]|nr:NAD-dependent succinate-semialdehyde dehydrogenase [Candidatus Baltobacteraceae bacterium]